MKIRKLKASARQGLSFGQLILISFPIVAVLKHFTVRKPKALEVDENFFEGDYANKSVEELEQQLNALMQQQNISSVSTFFLLFVD